MEHLTINKIIQFISFDEMTESNLKLASEVNSHMIECAECRKKVLSIQNTLERLLVYSEKTTLPSPDFVLDDDIQAEINAFYSVD